MRTARINVMPAPARRALRRPMAAFWPPMAVPSSMKSKVSNEASGGGEEILFGGDGFLSFWKKLRKKKVDQKFKLHFLRWNSQKSPHAPLFLAGFDSEFDPRQFNNLDPTHEMFLPFEGNLVPWRHDKIYPESIPSDWTITKIKLRFL